MLKRFFIAMLGTVAGLWLSLILFILMSFVAIGILVAKTVDTGGDKDKSILHIELSGDVPERQDDFSISSLLNFDLQESTSLADMIAAIDQAGDDSKIKGIYLDCKGASMGVATATELLEAIQRFKGTGKWVYAYSDNYYQSDYYVATAADCLYVNPVGMVNIHGLSATVVFFKDLLDKIGVDVQVFKVGQFKSAVEPFIRTSMSEPSRLQTSIFLDQIWSDMSTRIAENRDVEPAQVNAWADSMAMTWAPGRYVDNKVVTALRYRREVEEELKNKVGASDEAELPLVTVSDYLSSKEKINIKPEKKHIAVLYAVGDIVDDGDGGIVAAKIVPQIYELLDNDKVHGLVLRVNSGGGSAFASEQIWKALEDFKQKGKPFYVSMGDYAASGGYYISCGADVIYADAATLTGSIGIFGLIPNAKGLLQDKVGLGFETVETNDNANFPTYYTAMLPAQQAAMQQYVERGYETFTSRVAQGRNLPIDSVYAIGGGRVWDGISALNLGLVDRIGTLDKAIVDMADHLGISPSDVVCYPAVENKWVSLLTDKLGVESHIAPEYLQIKRGIERAKEITNLNPLQARMETVMLN